MEMLTKSFPVRYLGLLKIQRHVFITLCNKLQAKNYLKDLRYVSVYEQVAIFLLTIG